LKETMLATANLAETGSHKDQRNIDKRLMLKWIKIVIELLG
jgi:hypothetical protein